MGPTVIPELHRLRQESAALVKPLRADVSALCYYFNGRGATIAEVCERCFHKLPSNTFASGRFIYGEQADRSSMVRQKMAGQIANRLPVNLCYQNATGPPVAAPANPGFIEICAPLPVKMRVLVKPGVLMTMPCDLHQCRQIALLEFTDQRAFESFSCVRGRSLQCDSDVPQMKA